MAFILKIMMPIVFPGYYTTNQKMQFNSFWTGGLAKKVVCLATYNFGHFLLDQH